MKGARVQTSCSWGLQSPPALTLPLPEADIDARGRETERTLLWLNQVPVREKLSSEIANEAGVMLEQAREMETQVRETVMGLGTTNLSFTCQRKMVWGPQPGCNLRKFPSLQRQSEEGKGQREKFETHSHLKHTVCPNPVTHLVWKMSVKSCSRKRTREVSLQISFTYTCTTTESGPFS